jgi:Beta-ketoacyl synthase, N-terminal domain
MTTLQIESWSAWAPGLDTPEAWRDWLRDPQPLRGDEAASPPLSEVPAMARRRIEPLGRAALQVAYRAQQGWSTERLVATPLVFASRWAELARSVAMLKELADGQPLSPTAFSHSVHNAIGAQYSIQRAIRANVSAVAAGANSLEGGWVEAQGQIAAGAPSVLLTVFDAPLPEPYAGSALDAPLARLHAYALVLVPATSGITLQAGPPTALGQAEQQAEPLPASLAGLRFLIGETAELLQPHAAGSWRWRRD